RRGWAATTEALEGFEPRPGGPGLTWRGEGPEVQTDAGYPTIVRQLSPRRSLSEEYAFLAEHAHVRAKCCLPAPSYHRRFWYQQPPSGAYPTCQGFLEAVRGYLPPVGARPAQVGRDV